MARRIAITLLILPLFLLAGIFQTRAAEEEMPAFQQNDVIVFIGDSITDGGRARTGADYNHTMGQSYAYIISALLGNKLADKNLTFINRGISGNRITDLQGRWKTDVIDLKPKVLSILVGINDTLLPQHEPVEMYEQIYRGLLRDTLAALPGVRIVVGEPFLLPVGSHKGNYAVELAEVRKRQAVVAKLAAEFHLPLIRYQDVFDEACKRAPAGHWSWDGVHPHYAGHGLMAQEWIKAAGHAWQ